MTGLSTHDEGLPDGWEEVQDDAGRVYWWNVTTNETTWTRPVKVIATRGVAAGYVQKVTNGDGAGTVTPKPTALNLERIGTSSGGVAQLSARFSNLSTSGGSKATPVAKHGSAELATPPDMSSRTSATSVSALKKLQEAKEFLAQRDTAGTLASDIPTPPNLKPSSRGERADRPPKVNLYE
uniref:WW domain-containing protein n=1 Tax=Haptolina ericina TaxID=156174 RepID=A0A7S3B5R7_9EUKA|mmetsp:Transcript_48888/g.110013  ORF Transcript_48888/g.110013 Transcript_48888/m.110013 type:complete len:181 (+) Transcript_48888:79-621(+)